MDFSFLNHSYYGNAISEYLIALLIIFVSILAANVLYYVLHYPVRLLVNRTKTMADDQILEIVKWPIIFFVILWGFDYAFKTLYFTSGVRDYINDVILTLVVLNIIWLILKFFDLIVALYFYPIIQSSKSRLDNQVVPLVQKFIKVFIVVLGLFLILENLGVDTKALLTGLGIGGLAIALAAQSTLSNLFGSLAVVTDKPFKTGDIIKFINFGVVYEGVVKEVGLRSTKILTFDTTEIIVPNSYLTNIVIENISKRKAVKKQIILCFPYNTDSKQLEIAKKIIDNILLNEEGILDDYYTGVVNFSPAGIEMKVVYWVKYSGDYRSYLEIRHRIHSRIKKEFDEAKISFSQR